MKPLISDQVGAADEPAFGVRVVVVRIGDGFQDAPDTEARKPQGDQAEPDLAEGLGQERLKGAAAAAGLAARTDRRHERQGTDQSIDHAASPIAQPRQRFDGISMQVRHG